MGRHREGEKIRLGGYVTPDVAERMTEILKNLGFKYHERPSWQDFFGAIAALPDDKAEKFFRLMLDISE